MKSIFATGLVLFSSLLNDIALGGTCQFASTDAGPIAVGVCQRLDKYNGVESLLATCSGDDVSVTTYEDSLYCDAGSASDVDVDDELGSCEDTSDSCSLIEVTIEVYWSDTDCSEDPTTTYVYTYTTGADGVCVVTEEGDDRRRLLHNIDVNEGARQLLGRRSRKKSYSNPGESIRYTVNDEELTIEEFENDDCSGDADDTVTYETTGCVSTSRYGYTITILPTNGETVSRSPTDEPTENPVGWKKSWSKKSSKNSKSSSSSDSSSDRRL